VSCFLLNVAWCPMVGWPQTHRNVLLPWHSEFLVPAFPYDVPSEGLYSYLPRLLGRAKVSFLIRRKRTILGNITIIADGFAAPITAGTFDGFILWSDRLVFTMLSHVCVQLTLYVRYGLFVCVSSCMQETLWIYASEIFTRVYL
jgi:hypothetical protein